MAGYDVGAKFVGKEDKLVIATITEKTMIGGNPHYRLSIVPNLYNAQPRWLSEYGILIEFAPESSVKAKAKKKRGGFLGVFS